MGGFKSGHRVLIKQKYNNYVRRSKNIKREIDFTHLLDRWKIPKHLQENMRMVGFTDIDLWDIITNEELEGLQFPVGHRARFLAYVKRKRHVDDLAALQKE